MKKILIIFIGLISTSVFSYGCALCALQTPTAHVLVSFDTKNDTLENIHIKWEFSSTFTSQLYSGYDLNNNGKFEKKEKDDIKNTLIDYLKQKDYLTFLSYYDKTDEEPKHLNTKSKNDNFYMKNNQIFFEFDLPQKLKLQDKRVVKIQFLDDEGYFNFKILNKKPMKLGDLTIVPNINFSSAFFEVAKSSAVKQTIKKEQIKEVKKVAKKEQIKQEEQTNSFYLFLTKKLTHYTNKIKELFAKSKNNSYALLTLMFFSFVYGLFHAAGPGHGKMLVGSYFLANGGSYLRALGLCLKIGFIHVVGAFSLVLVSIYLIKTFMSKLIMDVTFYTTILASVIILILGFYLIYRKLTKKHTSSCSCHSCNHTHDKKQEWGIALAAGLVPCPGTVAIFILAFTFGNYISGFLSAISLALGMSAIIFVVSVFGNIIHVKTSTSFNSLLSKIEYIGLFLLIILGFIMLLSAFGV